MGLATVILALDGQVVEFVIWEKPRVYLPTSNYYTRLGLLYRRTDSRGPMSHYYLRTLAVISQPLHTGVSLPIRLLNSLLTGLLSPAMGPMVIPSEERTASCRRPAGVKSWFTRGVELVMLPIPRQVISPERLLNFTPTLISPRSRVSTPRHCPKPR